MVIDFDRNDGITRVLTLERSCAEMDGVSLLKNPRGKIIKLRTVRMR